MEWGKDGGLRRPGSGQGVGSNAQQVRRRGAGFGGRENSGRGTFWGKGQVGRREVAGLARRRDDENSSRRRPPAFSNSSPSHAPTQPPPAHLPSASPQSACRSTKPQRPCNFQCRRQHHHKISSFITERPSLTAASFRCSGTREPDADHFASSRSDEVGAQPSPHFTR